MKSNLFKKGFKNIFFSLFLMFIGPTLLFQSFKKSSSIFNNEYGLANSKARLRMTTLYQAAAANDGLFLYY